MTLLNSTRVKIPKMYWDKVKFLDLNEETGLYETEAAAGYYFPTIESQWGSAKGHKGIWEVIRYVAELPVVEEVIEVVEEEQPSLDLQVEEVKASADMTIKELWALGKELGLKGCTRWAKTKLIEEINKTA